MTGKQEDTEDEKIYLVSLRKSLYSGIPKICGEKIRI